jgi:hypothetical protein
MPLNLKGKVRGIQKHTHPAEIAEFLTKNAGRIKSGVVILDYEDESGRQHTHERYIGDWTNTELAWWVACLQESLMRCLRDS